MEKFGKETENTTLSTFFSSVSNFSSTRMFTGSNNDSTFISASSLGPSQILQLTQLSLPNLIKYPIRLDHHYNNCMRQELNRHNHSLTHLPKEHTYHRQLRYTYMQYIAKARQYG